MWLKLGKVGVNYAILSRIYPVISSKNMVFGGIFIIVGESLIFVGFRRIPIMPH